MARNGQIGIVSAFLVGCALVAGAYTLNSLSRAAAAPTEAGLYATVAEASARVAIPVTDSNEDGVEDWREPFLSHEVMRLDEPVDDYEPADTFTEQMSIDFMERVLLAKGRGQFGVSTEEIVRDTAKRIAAEGVDTLYRADSISIVDDTPENVRAYANAAALAILDNNADGLRHELLILEDALATNNPQLYEELRTLAQVYEKTRDATLKIPVPRAFVKQHLDVINSYHALHNNIAAMAKASEDPLLALVRLKRYEDDALGLAYALRNLYFALEPHAQLFTPDDPAVLFIVFRPAT
jgi:hypothetical protein